MVERFLCIAVLFASSRAVSSGVSELIYVASDPARGGREVKALLYLRDGDFMPAPVVAFGHGFGLGTDMYPLAREVTAQRGMAVFLPYDWGVLPSTLNLALDQVFLLMHAVEQSAQNMSSPLFGRVSNKTLLMGHSLGGGSTVLASDSILAGAYDDPTAIATVSLGTYTIPGALASAPRSSPHVPALLFTATEDCIDPPKSNSMLVFDALQTQCKFVVSVVGGSHCQYAAFSEGCHITEELCGARPNISNTEQVQVTLSVLFPYLDAALGNDTSKGWRGFFKALSVAASSGNVEVLAKQTASCGAPARPDLIDSGFADRCQRLLVGDGSIKLNISEFRAGEGTFLTTKPTLQRDDSGKHVDITIVSHVEQSDTFSRSIAVKMKSGAAVTAGNLVDNTTCADLHAESLTIALGGLDAEERSSYRLRTKMLVFGADEVWSTGLWVAEARLNVRDDVNEVTIVAPRFESSVGLPAGLGGMFYCRLLPPSAIRNWIRAQLASNAQLAHILV